MTRAWLAVLAAAVVAGCGSSRPASGNHDALDYASAYYRGTMARLLWPRWEPLTRLAARASCRTAQQHYRIDEHQAFADAFARRAHRLDRAHNIVSLRAELARSCVSGIERPLGQEVRPSLWAGSGGGCIVAPGSGNGRGRGWRSRFGSSWGCGSPTASGSSGNTVDSSSPTSRRSN